MNLAPLRVYSTLSSYSSVLGLLSSRDFIMELLFFSRFSSKFLKSLFSPPLFSSFVFLSSLSPINKITGSFLSPALRDSSSIFFFFCSLPFLLKNLPNHLTKPIINENKPTLKFFWVHVKAIYVASDYYFLKIN